MFPIKINLLKNIANKERNKLSNFTSKSFDGEK